MALTYENLEHTGYHATWLQVAAGRLASGDCAAAIHVWEPAPGGRWAVSQAYRGHANSVEDLQWSPTETTVFASCSVDRSIRIWDSRDSSKSQLEVAAAHPTDVNVISWNRQTTYTLASGGDDGGLRVWDLRHLSTSVANLTYHKYAPPPPPLACLRRATESPRTAHADRSHPLRNMRGGSDV